MAWFRRRPAHSPSLSKPAEHRLHTLGEHIPPPATPAPINREVISHLRRYLVMAVVVAIIVLAGVQWFRPLPPPVFGTAVSTSLRLAGTPPMLPWPTVGSAALSVEGAGSLGQVGSTQPIPIASIAKVLTAYVVLKDHPLTTGATGPAITVTADTFNAYQAGMATQQSEVPVTAGESLTEQQALEGLLVASGNDMATLFADWDAGSTASFVTKMNSTAHALGLASTNITDPSGLDDTTVSTPEDLITLGETAMGIPALAQIVAMPQVTLPMAGLVYNFDYLLGHDGFVGIKTGSDSAAGGCFLFEAQRIIGAKTVTLVGAVLGQEGTSSVEATLEVADLLVNAAFMSIKSLPLLQPGQVVGRIADKWGSSVPVTALTSPMIIGWPGMTVPIGVRVAPLPSPLTRGVLVGQLSFDRDDLEGHVALQPSRSLRGPSVLWRLTRL